MGPKEIEKPRDEEREHPRAKKAQRAGEGPVPHLREGAL
jgi:hypothetical protein